MAKLRISPTRKYFRIGDKDHYCIFDGSRMVGRISRPPQAPYGHPWFWTITAKEMRPTVYKQGYAATRDEATQDLEEAWVRGVILRK